MASTQEPTAFVSEDLNERTKRLCGHLPIAKTDKKYGAPFFTGWKGFVFDAFADPIVPLPESGFVAQWVCFFRPSTVVYVNLPNFSSGAIPAGSTFEIGADDQRVYPSIFDAELVKMVEMGHHQLLVEIAKFGGGEWTKEEVA